MGQGAVATGSQTTLQASGTWNSFPKEHRALKMFRLGLGRHRGMFFPRKEAKTSSLPNDAIPDPDTERAPEGFFFFSPHALEAFGPKLTPLSNVFLHLDAQLPKDKRTLSLTPKAGELFCSHLCITEGRLLFLSPKAPAMVLSS